MYLHISLLGEGQLVPTFTPPLELPTSSVGPSQHPPQGALPFQNANSVAQEDRWLKTIERELLSLETKFLVEWLSHITNTGAE